MQPKSCCNFGLKLKFQNQLWIKDSQMHYVRWPAAQIQRGGKGLCSPALMGVAGCLTEGGTAGGVGVGGNGDFGWLACRSGSPEPWWQEQIETREAGRWCLPSIGAAAGSLDRNGEKGGGGYATRNTTMCVGDGGLILLQNGWEELFYHSTLLPKK